MDRRKLLSALLREYIFTLAYRAFAESLASENASRLSSMQSAERNIEDRLDDLGERYNFRRQNAITAEMLDIAAGAEAMKQK
jgi:F-type H+-transporting ATPase subunit gamma